MSNVWILAQAPGKSVESQPVGKEDNTAQQQQPGAPGGANAPQPAKPGFQMSQLLIIGVMAVLMYFVLFRGPRKKQHDQQQMIKALKKNDKVRTIGGMYGTIVDIKDDDVILKVDESNNTKIRVSASAIGKTISSE
jgi:preprotein translocase subunit YajC